jgi:hypothetical protein
MRLTLCANISIRKPDMHETTDSGESAKEETCGSQE